MGTALTAGMAAALVLMLSATARAATIIVNTLLDESTSGDGLCSLREAITNADEETDTTSGDCAAGSGNDRINFIISGTINLSASLPPVYEALGIDGTGERITVDGSGSYQVIAVNSGATLDLNRLTIADGNSLYGGGINNAGTLTVTSCSFSANSASYGAGINNEGTLTLTNCGFTANSAIFGAGIENDAGTVTVTKSTFSRSSANYGGGIDTSGTLTVSDSTFSGNSCTFGGGISSDGTLTVIHSTFSGNSCTYGGGISSDGILTAVSDSTFSGDGASGYGGGIENDTGTTRVTNSTFSGNGAYYGGGGIENDFGTLIVTNSTFSRNSAAGYGGAIGNDGGPLTLTNSTFSGNSSDSSEGGGIGNKVPWQPSLKSIILAASIGGDCAGTITDVGYNIADDASCKFKSIDSHNGTNPKLDPRGLRNNGGRTQTIALESGSPAINVIPIAECTNQASPPKRITTDQRGFPRPDHHEHVCDIGAFESQF